MLGAKAAGLPDSRLGYSTGRRQRSNGLHMGQSKPGNESVTFTVVIIYLQRAYFALCFLHWHNKSSVIICF